MLQPLADRDHFDYDVNWQLGTAYESAQMHEDAVSILERLRGHSEVGIEWYVNLGRAYLLSSNGVLARANDAFELFCEAWRRYPLEPSLPQYILRAGICAKRGHEAWQIIGACDLTDNPYLFPVPMDLVAISLAGGAPTRNSKRSSALHLG